MDWFVYVSRAISFSSFSRSSYGRVDQCSVMKIFCVETAVEVREISLKRVKINLLILF